MINYDFYLALMQSTNILSNRNVFEVMFTLCASIIKKEQKIIVKDTEIQRYFDDLFDETLPLQVVHTIMDRGRAMGAIEIAPGEPGVRIYRVNGEITSQILAETFDSSSREEYERLLDELKRKFDDYCTKKSVNVPENFISEMLEKTEEKLLRGGDYDTDEYRSADVFNWYNFISELYEKAKGKNKDQDSEKLYDFLTCVCLSGVATKALFYAVSNFDNSGNRPNYSGMNVYLDAPVVFSLLGYNEEPVVESCKLLVENMKKAGCNLHIFEHNLDEVQRILFNACNTIAKNVAAFEIDRVNKVTQIIYDRYQEAMLQGEDIKNWFSTFFSKTDKTNIENQLVSMGITICEANHNSTENAYQVDETELKRMIEVAYSRGNAEYNVESVIKDVQSIQMLYRLRKGSTAHDLRNVKHVMLTYNRTVVKCCTQYERSINEDYLNIPVCITDDYFGAILWLQTPSLMKSYGGAKLLAEVYAYLKPSKKMLEKFREIVNQLKRDGKINSKNDYEKLHEQSVIQAMMMKTHGDVNLLTAEAVLEANKEVVDILVEKLAMPRSNKMFMPVINDLKRDIRGRDETIGKLNDENRKKDEIIEQLMKERAMKERAEVEDLARQVKSQCENEANPVESSEQQSGSSQSEQSKQNVEDIAEKVIYKSSCQKYLRWGGFVFLLFFAILLIYVVNDVCPKGNKFITAVKTIVTCLFGGGFLWLVKLWWNFVPALAKIFVDRKFNNY